MAYDGGLAERIRAALAGRDDVVEKKMFGGITLMVAGRLACGCIHDDLRVKVGHDGHDAAMPSRTSGRRPSPADRCGGWSTSRQLELRSTRISGAG